MIELALDRGAGTPTHLQPAQQVRQTLRIGALAPGKKLPTAAEVVVQPAIRPNAVLKAYREIEREGLVAPRLGLDADDIQAVFASVLLDDLRRGVA